LPKAKVLKPQADKLITLGKKNSLQNTRALISKLQNEGSASKIRKTLLEKI
jgi:Ribosomal protein L17